MSNLIEEEFELEEDTQKSKFLTFILGKEVYGIEIKYVTEIIGIQSITEIPELPEYIIGIINLRGKIIPVMDVRARFKKELRDYNDRTCIIVIHIKDTSIGLIVDSVSEVTLIPEGNIVPPPEINKSYKNRYISGIGKVCDEVKLILNCDKLLNDDEVDDINRLV
ncbi:chemotaxis protein CheW [Clostridium uliginosum]|uniref:Purine-binding chemotaxis protein CheW n=1 Tax=Clostridium uliginosum TaxID=119641 RepID=A0A1I1N1J7_9CLOT|nr:chemotaxis protein CheW [Clostridium uliginosum]SFC91564.1 purine-binding chemotaxis protein CheW [Clostridium uliginosum]